MTKLPVLRPKEVLRILRTAGFFIDHQTGAHVTLLNAQGRRVTVAHHSRELKRGTLKSIIDQSGLPIEAFWKGK